MNREEIKTEIFRIINVELNINEATKEEQSLQDDLDFDDLDVVEFVMEIEKTFDIIVNDHEFDRIRTVGDAIDMVANEIK